MYATKLELKHPKLNHKAEIVAKYHSTNILLNFNLILGRDILHELLMIFYFENKTIPLQEVSISTKHPECKSKEPLIIKESRPDKNTIRRIQQILGAE